MLTKDLLRISRRGGGYRPQFTDDARLAARVIGCYQGHVGETRGTLRDSLDGIERESDDFKLVRGFAKLLEREVTWEVRAPVTPLTARETAFEASEAVGVVTETERDAALERAAERLAVDVADVEQSLYADLDARELLVAAETDYTPETLVAQYNLSLAQTALFDATEIRIQTTDPKRLISAVKRLRLLYEIKQLPKDEQHVDTATREIIVTGPDALFRRSKRYGTRFARLLRTLTKTAAWRLVATIDDRGTERTLVLTETDLGVPEGDPLTELGYDSEVEASFARRFEALELPWELVREPDPLAAGEHVIIPDFAFDWRHGEFRVYFEIMGFWTPEYIEKKRSRLADVEGVALIVAVDESLGVGEAIEALDHRVIGYTGEIRLRDLRGVLRTYEDELVAAAAEQLPDVLRPEGDVVALAELATEQGVSEDALDGVEFPDHKQVGRTLIRHRVLATLGEQVEDGMEYEDVERVLTAAGFDDLSSVLSELGYRVVWDGLSGGVVRETN